MLSILVYGKPGVGKTTFAASFPDMTIIDAENGAKFIKGVPVSRVKTYQELKEAVKNCKTKNICIDSITAVERLIWGDILLECKAKTMATAFGGYGQGYAEAVQRFRKLAEYLEENFNLIVYTAHPAIKTQPNPSSEPFEAYNVSVHKQLQEYCTIHFDEIFFMSLETHINEGKITNTSNRILTTKDAEWCVCKDRIGLPAVCTVEEAKAKILEIVKGG